jgi:hypothetical protein
VTLDTNKGWPSTASQRERQPGSRECDVGSICVCSGDWLVRARCQVTKQVGRVALPAASSRCPTLGSTRFSDNSQSTIHSSRSFDATMYAGRVSTCSVALATAKARRRPPVRAASSVATSWLLPRGQLRNQGTKPEHLQLILLNCGPCKASEYLRRDASSDLSRVELCSARWRNNGHHHTNNCRLTSSRRLPAAGREREMNMAHGFSCFGSSSGYFFGLFPVKGYHQWILNV